MCIDTAGTRKCSQESCINRNLKGICNILNYVDDNGINCHFFKSSEMSLEEKENLRKIYYGPNGHKRFEKILLYNPALYADSYFADIIGEIENKVS